MTTNERGQVTRNPAEVYDEVFVPAALQQWAERVADAAKLQRGQRVLDVACGTGVLTRAVAERVGPEGAVVGLDRNEGMLAVARRNAPDIEWRQGNVEAMSFESRSFDAVVSQFGLIFFANRRAVDEMTRVLRPGGHLAVAVWSRLEDSPGYAAFTDLLQRRVSAQAADEERAAFALGDPQLLRSHFEGAALSDLKIETIEGTARFDSIRSMVLAEVYGWTLGEVMDEAQVEQLLQEAESVLQPFVTVDGTLVFPLSANILAATKA
ncbi:MAG TPA: methyltransferase domain-containing protein [Chloroflexia bacterium]|nr:methyltransferase domain-containing protein [Chloroflexia bacterium]